MLVACRTGAWHIESKSKLPRLITIINSHTVAVSVMDRGKNKNMFSVMYLLSLSLAKSNSLHGHPTLSVSASHLYYTCPEGANATLVCNQRGATLHPNDTLWHLWFFTPHKDRHCTSQHGPRNMTLKHAKLPPGLHFGATQENFWVQLQHLTHADQGRYCCALLEFENTHHNTVQRTHSHLFLKILPSKSICCVGFPVV